MKIVGLIIFLPSVYISKIPEVADPGWFKKLHREKRPQVGPQEHIKNNPTDTIRVEPTDLQIYSNDATVLNDQEYRSIMISRFFKF